ncbi:DUF2577 family protein [Lachnospiraceae bacterium 46-15]
MPNDSLIQLIKRIAVSAVEASKPCNTFTGKVMEVSPLEISIGQKIILDDEFITLTSTVKEKIKRGSNVLMIRQAGGQRYIVVDTL